MLAASASGQRCTVRAFVCQNWQPGTVNCDKTGKKLVRTGAGASVSSV